MNALKHLHSGWNIWGKIKIVVSDQQPFMIDGIIGFLGHYPEFI